ncbi:MAG: glucose-6-phosphate dehydrogenase [Methylotenera sp.]|jgi:glucose-6-phosphate 1-dehydrogenase|nr:glucose-6-phosphate dehydrogenase [Methylotenera sp.]
MAKKIDPCTLVLFGASGNLSRIKLMPGLFRLDAAGRLPEHMAILSVGRGELSREDWAAQIKGMLDAKFKNGYDEKVFERFIARNHYHANPPTDPDAFKKLAAKLADASVFPQNLAYFLSVRPTDFAVIVAQLAGVGLVDESQYWRRVLIEKPFGTDLPSAQALQAELTKYLKESQIYRIDHYLGKSAIQNIMLTRFTNAILEPLWNNAHIDHVQITNNETLGVGDRTTFYNATGALRDMFQSHLLQTLALVAMEKPDDLKPESIRAEKIKLLQSIRPIDVKNIGTQAFRAQYAAGRVCVGDGHGENVHGYLEELKRDGIESSNTETYAAVKLFIDNPRWKGVPFYVRTAKRMHEGNTAISIRFKKAPMALVAGQHQNWLTINIQPRECIKLEIESKIPGLDIATRTLSIDAPQRQSDDETIDSYETLMLNLMEGDPSQYLHISEVEAQWKLVDPIVKAWTEDKSALHQYAAGSRDPHESSVIFESQDQFWRYSIELGGDKH